MCGLEYLTGEKLISFKRRKVLDIDYLIDIIFRKEFPLDIEKLHSSNIDVIVPATCWETGEVAYFNSKNKVLDWFEVLRAAKALPIVYGKKVKIGDLRYFDTPHSSTWSAHLQKVEDLGATHTVILNLNRLYTNRFAEILGEYVVKNYFFAEGSQYKPVHNPNKENFEKNTDTNVFIKPTELGNNLETDKQAIQKLWDAGYKESLENQDLENLLKNLQN